MVVVFVLRLVVVMVFVRMPAGALHGAQHLGPACAQEPPSEQGDEGQRRKVEERGVVPSRARLEDRDEVMRGGESYFR